jgi:hypothetical protein
LWRAPPPVQILLVTAKILLVAMPRRDQQKKNSIGRSKNSVGRDVISSLTFDVFIAWFSAKILYHGTSRRKVHQKNSEPWNNLYK